MTDRVPLPETLIETTVDAPREDLNQHPIPDNFMDSIIKTRIAELTDASDIEHDMELDNVLKWARDRGATEPAQVFQEVRDILNRIGSPSVGEKMISKLNRYIYFDNEKFEADKAMREMERNG